MQVTASQRKQGSGGEHLIGFFKGPLCFINPDKETLEKIYGTTLEADPKYTGEDKNGKPWSRLLFVFQDEATQKYVPYSLFISDELAEFDADDKNNPGEKVKRTWWLNQWGQSQLVDKEENLFKSFTHMQKQNEEKTGWEDVLDESGNPVKLIYRQAYRGETALYSLLRTMVTQDWFQADADTNLFVPMKALLRGITKDISMYIGTDTFQPVVGMMYVEAKDTENGVQYNNNCIDGAWLAGWKIKDVNINSASNSWGKFDVAPKGKGSWKLKDMYSFYQSVKRNKHMWEFSPLHVFEADKFQAAGSQTFIPSTESETPNDISY